MMSKQTNTEQTLDELPGEERGMPSVNETGPSNAKRGLIVIVILLILCAAFGIGYWRAMRRRKKPCSFQARFRLVPFKSRRPRQLRRLRLRCRALRQLSRLLMVPRLSPWLRPSLARLVRLAARDRQQMPSRRRR
jgi:hypothetical protein